MKKIIYYYYLIILISLLAFFNHTLFAEILTEEQILNEVNKKITNIGTSELIKILDEEPDAVLIDVRTAEEIKTVGTIARGQNQRIERGWLEFKIGDYTKKKDARIIVYCGKNTRSPLAALSLQEMGFTNVKNYSEGYFKWKEAGLPVWISDKATDSILYEYPRKVTHNVYSAIGATQPPTYENSNHNNNLSFIITNEGVLVFNAGGSYQLAKAMHTQIKKLTNQPVKYVVLENAQGHAILGSNYWKEQGAEIIAHKYAKEIIEANGENILRSTANRMKDKIEYTKVVLPDRTFDDKLVIEMGEEVFEILYLGESHSHEDIQMWLPKQRLLISGDTAFNERMLPIFSHTEVLEWLETWDKLVELDPEIIIPGHGVPTDLATVTKFTKNYLEYMVEKVTELVDEGAELPEAYEIDQSPFRDWKTYQELHRQNAGRIFRKLEF